MVDSDSSDGFNGNGRDDNVRLGGNKRIYKPDIQGGAESVRYPKKDTEKRHRKSMSRSGERTGIAPEDVGRMIGRWQCGCTMF